MIGDSQAWFIPPGSTLAVTNATVYTPVLDLLGLGVGVNPGTNNPGTGASGQGVIWGNSSVFGTDMGIGGVRPDLAVTVGTAFAGGTSLTVKFQGAADPGSAGNWTPTTWTDFMQSPACLQANLTANQFIFRTPFPPAFPPGSLVRFVRLAFVPVGTFTAGTIACSLLTMGRPDPANRYAAANYKVA